MKKKSKPPPTPRRPTYRRYDVSALAREHGLEVPVRLSQKVWQTCIRKPTDSHSMEMAARLDDLLVQLAEVVAGNQEMATGVAYELSEATVANLPPDCTSLPEKLKAVCEETVSNYLVLTVYLATEAQIPVYVADVYLDDEGRIALITPRRSGPVVVPKGA